MTTAEAPAAVVESARKHVARNWAAVLIFIVGAGGLVFTLIHAVTQNDVAGSVLNILILLFNYFPAVICVLVASFVLAFGTGHLAGIVRGSRLGRVTLVLWGLLNAASQIAFVGEITDDAGHFDAAQNIQLTISIATILVGLVAAVFILRAHVVTGFARISLFVALVLFAATEALVVSGDLALGEFWDVPRVAGVAILGLSYWRAGVPATTNAVVD